VIGRQNRTTDEHGSEKIARIAKIAGIAKIEKQTLLTTKGHEGTRRNTEESKNDGAPDRN
jgi:hypothetical protein